ncbi:MAG: ABC transporter permease [Planctomycetota bacterium]
MIRRRQSDDPPLPAGSRISVVTIVPLIMLGLFLVAVAGLVGAALSYDALSWATFGEVLRSPEVRAAIRLSLVSSAITLLVVTAVAVPTGYALSRLRFPGRTLADTIVDLPIVLPPVVIGICLLVLFATAPGRQMERWIEAAGYSLHSVIGIVLCQFFVSVSYAIRAAKAAFDSVPRRLEQIALTLGCTRLGAFRRVTLPLAASGLTAGAIMSWARAIGVFGPLMVFVGTTRMKVETMPTTIYLELSIGRIPVAIAVAAVMVVLAGAALAVVHWLAPGKAWS